MRTAKRILVGMDFTSTDDRLVKFVSALNGPLAIEKVYFLHVSPSLEIPEYMSEVYRKELQELPLDEKFKIEMESEVRTQLTDVDFETEFEVVEGPVTRKLVQWSKVKQIDLAVVGKKEPLNGSGISVKRFLRRTNCSVLFVPNRPVDTIKRILVPVDFSENSNHALEAAIDLASKMKPAPVIEVLNIFDVPTELQYRISRTYAQFAEIVKANAESFFPEYLARFDFKGVEVKSVLIQNTHFNTARHIMEHTQSANTDLIMMGAQGHSALESILLGSVTEKLLAHNDEVATWVIRPEVVDEEDDEPIESHSSLHAML